MILRTTLLCFSLPNKNIIEIYRGTFELKRAKVGSFLRQRFALAQDVPQKTN